MLNKLKAFVKTKRSDYVRKKLIDPRYGFLFDEPPTDEWVSLDLEMTGLNPKNDDILSVGAVLIKRVADDQGGGRYIIDTKSCLSLVCRPRVMPTTDSIVIHGLRPMDVMDGISHDDMVAQLLPMIGARPLVGFCIDLDVQFLNQLLRSRLGVSLPNRRIDVSMLDQRVRQRHNKNPDITIDRRHLNDILIDHRIPRLSAHDAMHDALMTAMLFCQLNTAQK